MKDANEALHAGMTAASVFALWEQVDRHKFPPEPPHLWAWRTLEPLVDLAIRATTIENAERRVLVLNNPSFAGSDRDGATLNLGVNLQILMPGERARPHRHTMNALRFILEGDGASTIVEGKPCPMARGDVILTPGWTWHEHVHSGSARCVWVDVLDVPFQRLMRTALFEPGPVKDPATLPPDAAFAAPGVAPRLGVATPPYSPLFRYPYASAGAALLAAPEASDGSRRVRYTHPLTGEPAMATIDAGLIALSEGRATRAHRSTASTVCVVLEGAGRSRIGETTLEWTRNDVFSVPHGLWASHTATAPGTVLFEVSDREILRRVHLLREEYRE